MWTAYGSAAEALQIPRTAVSSTGVATASTRRATTLLLCLSLGLLSACGGDNQGGLEPVEVADDIVYPTAPAQQIPLGLHAEISADNDATLQASISGPGAYRQVPTRRQRPGYHYLADGNPDDGFEVILILPKAATPGVFIMSPSTPFDTGSDYSAKVESREHGSFSYNTEGLLTLNQLQSIDEHHTLASGTFTFAVENENGERIVVDGRFNFQP